MPASSTGHIYLDQYLGCAHIATCENDVRTAPGGARPPRSGAQHRHAPPPPREQVAASGAEGLVPLWEGRAEPGASRPEARLGFKSGETGTSGLYKGGQNSTCALGIPLPPTAVKSEPIQTRQIYAYVKKQGVPLEYPREWATV